MIFLIALPLFLSFILFKNRDQLEKEEKKKSYGSLYAGKNVNEERNHCVYFYPPIFFFRRLFFICASVYLFKKPAMQMIVH